LAILAQHLVRKNFTEDARQASYPIDDDDTVAHTAESGPEPEKHTRHQLTPQACPTGQTQCDSGRRSTGPSPQSPLGVCCSMRGLQANKMGAPRPKIGTVPIYCHWVRALDGWVLGAPSDGCRSVHACCVSPTWLCLPRRGSHASLATFFGSMPRTCRIDATCLQRGRPEKPRKDISCQAVSPSEPWKSFLDPLGQNVGVWRSGRLQNGVLPDNRSRCPSQYLSISTGAREISSLARCCRGRIVFTGLRKEPARGISVAGRSQTCLPTASCREGDILRLHVAALE